MEMDGMRLQEVSDYAPLIRPTELRGNIQATLSKVWRSRVAEKRRNCLVSLAVEKGARFTRFQWAVYYSFGISRL